MIEIKEVLSRKDLKRFVDFPFELYKNSKTWVPPIKSQEMNALDKNVNPVFDNADARLFLAYKGESIVGRVAALVNWLEVKDHGVKKLRFGWFDVVDDINVTRALLDQVESVARALELETIEGPIGFTNLDKVGVVTEGFDHIANMITWHNYPYYADHFRELGFETGKRYSESKFPFDNVKPDYFMKASAMIEKRYQLRTMHFSSTKAILPYAHDIFRVFEQSHAELASFVDINERQREFFKNKFIKFLNPEFVKLVFDKDDQLVAFGIVTPFYGEALQKMKGKLYPFRFRHLLKAKKQSRSMTFYLIGILPEYKNKGVTALIFNAMYPDFKKRGVEYCIRGPELEENTAIQNIWKHFDPKVFKRRCTFVKKLAEN